MITIANDTSSSNADLSTAQSEADEADTAPRRTSVARAIVGRILFLPFAVFIAATAAFWLVNLLPSNPGAQIAGSHATDEQVAAINQELGLDEPLISRYGDFLVGITNGDFGTSYFTEKPIRQEMVDHLAATVTLVVAGTFVAVVLGQILGFVGGFFRNRFATGVARLVTSFVQSTPDFLLGLLLILLFFVVWPIAPAPTGQLSPMTFQPDRVTGSVLVDSILVNDSVAFEDALRHLALPALALGLHFLGFFSNSTRQIVAQRVTSGSTEFARGLGLQERRIAGRVLRHSRSSRYTYTGLLLASLIGGSALVEKVFSWDGYSIYIVEETLRSNLPAIQGFVFISAVVTVIIFLVVDLLTSFRDPRVETFPTKIKLSRPERRRAQASAGQRWDRWRDAGRDEPVDRNDNAAVAVAGKEAIAAALVPDEGPNGWAGKVRGGMAWARDRRSILLPAGFIAFLVVAAMVLPLPHDPGLTDSAASMKPPSGTNWFGTDSVGRDVFSRVVIAAKTDIPLAMAGTLASLVIGTTLGLLASETSRLGNAIMRGLDIFQALPLLVLAVAIVVLTGDRLTNVVIAIMLFGVPSFVRISRSAAMVVRKRRFVEAAEAAGAGRSWVLRKEVLPNIAGHLAAQVSNTGASAVMVIASLSFLGVGIRPPTASWGAMLQESTSQVVTGNWWTTIFPGLFLVSVVWCMNSIGHAINRWGES